MADCSKTVDFLKERKRLCDSYNCKMCPVQPFFKIPDVCPLFDDDLYGEKLIDFVQKWSDEHPEPKPKTYADDFFEKFPNAPYRIEDGLKIPKICRTGCYAVKCSYPRTGLFNTPECNKCWNEPYKEGEQ